MHRQDNDITRITRAENLRGRKPYQSPSVLAERMAAPSPISPFAAPTPRVQGKLLIIRDGDVLPRYCVKTNQPVTVVEMRTKEFTWCSPLVGLLMLISGPLLILVYFLARKRFYLTFGLSDELRQRYRYIYLAKVIAAVALFFTMPLSAAAGNVVPVIVLILFIGAVVSLFLGNSPLAATNYRNGEFWITGCSKNFLATVASADPLAR
jgi:hypothetical protein